MGVFDIIRGAFTFLTSSAPYPIRMAFWIIVFLTLGGIFSFFFSLSVACTSAGELYKPDSYFKALDIQLEALSLDDSFNVSFVNASNVTIVTNESHSWFYKLTGGYHSVGDSDWWAQLWGAFATTQINETSVINEPDGTGSYVTFPNGQRIFIESEDAVNAKKFLEYDELVKSKATKIEYDGDELVTFSCDTYRTTMSLAGIDFFDKELWVVLGIAVILAPFLSLALKRRKD